MGLGFGMLCFRLSGLEDCNCRTQTLNPKPFMPPLKSEGLVRQDVGSTCSLFETAAESECEGEALGLGFRVEAMSLTVLSLKL